LKSLATQPVPLRLSAGRFALYSIGLAAIGILQIVHSHQFAFWDWPTFAGAAVRVGTPGLLDPKPLADAFTYLPGAAWLLAPLRGLSPAAGFATNAVAMLAAALAAAATARRIYGFSLEFCAAAVLAWVPTTYAVVIGQNAPLGLLLVLLSLLGFTRGAPLLTALPLALLLYKPTYALPLLGLLALRGRRRELGIVAVGAGVWYLVSVFATGGDWGWPRAWLALERAFFAPDFAHNASKAIGLTTTLIRWHAPGALVIALALLVVAASLPSLRRAPAREAYAAACLLGLIVSPHAWSYDAVLMLPMLFVAVTELREPVRTPAVCAAYAVAPSVIVAHQIGFTPLALLVIGGYAWWLSARWKRAVAT
jgi:hypothetical protein